MNTDDKKIPEPTLPKECEFHQECIKVLEILKNNRTYMLSNMYKYILSVKQNKRELTENRLEAARLILEHFNE